MLDSKKNIIALAISPIEQAEGVYCEEFCPITTMKRSVDFPMESYIVDYVQWTQMKSFICFIELITRDIVTLLNV